MSKPKRRTCADRQRFQRLTELRQWRDTILAESNRGRVEQLIRGHPAVRSLIPSYGWKCWATVTLNSGHDFLAGDTVFGIDCLRAVTVYVYVFLRRRLL